MTDTFLIVREAKKEIGIKGINVDTLTALELSEFLLTAVRPLLKSFSLSPLNSGRTF